MHCVSRRRAAVWFVAVLMGVLSGAVQAAVIGDDPDSGSYLEDVGGLLVLHLKGTPEQMGRAHGRLLADQVKTVANALDRTLDRVMSAAEQTAASQAARPHLNARYVAEVQAIAAGANEVLGEGTVDAERLLELHSWDEIARNSMDHGAGAHFAALTGATSDGHVLLGTDFVNEPALRRGVQDGAVVIVYEPDQGHTFCVVSWAGFAGAMVGVNSQGLAVSEVSFPARGQREDGTPMAFLIRRVLESASNVPEAEQILASARRTTASTILVADGVDQSAIRAFESNANQFVSFTEGDPDESHDYTLARKSTHVVINLDELGFPVPLDLPDLPNDLPVNVSAPLPNAIVRSGWFAHYGAGSLQEQQCLWVITDGAEDPDFDFLDLSGLPVTYKWPSLDIAIMVDRILSGRARELISDGLIGILDSFVPGWDIDLAHPDNAAPARYWSLSDALEGQLGSLNADVAVEILSGPRQDVSVDVLIDPGSLHAVVIDATTMSLRVATAAPKDSIPNEDASYQPFRAFEFSAYATYPLTITTTPAGGEVFVDGQSWGAAPQTRRVLAGQYEISFGDLAGYAKPSDRIATVGTSGATVTGDYERRYAVVVTKEGQGSVEPNGGAFAPGTLVAFEATPSSGWQFVGWSGALSGSNPSQELTINGDVLITATFEPIPPDQHQLTVLQRGQGTVVPSTGSYQQGAVASLEATPAQGWYFLGWEEDASGKNPNIQITMNTDKIVRAVFGQGPYAVRATIEGQGEVGPLKDGYQEDEAVEVYATPAEGWHFVGWSGDVSGEAPWTGFTVRGDVAITARFAQNPAGQSALTVQVDGNGQVTPSSGLYATGSQVSLSAVADACNAFTEWMGDIESTDPNIQLTLNGNRVVRAVFESRGSYSLTVDVQGQGSVISTPPGGEHECGSQVTLEAVVGEAAPNWEFLRWQGDVPEGTHENPLTITMDRDKEVLAVFVQKAAPADSSQGAPCCGGAAPPMMAMLMVACVLMTSKVRRLR